MCVITAFPLAKVGFHPHDWCDEMSKEAIDFRCLFLRIDDNKWFITKLQQGNVSREELDTHFSHVKSVADICHGCIQEIYVWLI